MNLAPFSALAFGLAALTFVALWIYALSHVGPRSLMQKSVITLILVWLESVAGLLMRSRR